MKSKIKRFNNMKWQCNNHKKVSNFNPKKNCNNISTQATIKWEKAKNGWWLKTWQAGWNTWKSMPFLTRWPIWMWGVMKRTKQTDDASWFPNKPGVSTSIAGTGTRRWWLSTMSSFPCPSKSKRNPFKFKFKKKMRRELKCRGRGSWGRARNNINNNISSNKTRKGRLRLRSRKCRKW